MPIDNLTLQAAVVNPGIGTINAADQINPGPQKGVKVVVDISAIAGGATLTVTVEGKDPVTGKYFTLLASAALAAAATTVLTVYPGAVVTANLSANDQLPRTWRVKAAVAVANNISYSIGAILLD